MKIDIFFSASKKAVRLDVYFHFLFILKLIKKRKELNSISNKIYLFVTAPYLFVQFDILMNIHDLHIH